MRTAVTVSLDPPMPVAGVRWQQQVTIRRSGQPTCGWQLLACDPSL
jgi:hypothetical protein